jgi:hypothetical protein
VGRQTEDYRKHCLHTASLKVVAVKRDKDTMDRMQKRVIKQSVGMKKITQTITQWLSPFYHGVKKI